MGIMDSARNLLGGAFDHVEGALDAAAKAVIKDQLK